jgi:hypothetical protein
MDASRAASSSATVSNVALGIGVVALGAGIVLVAISSGERGRFRTARRSPLALSW